MKHILSFCLSASLLAPPGWAQTLDETFSSSGADRALTDQEQVEANTYYHQGRAQTVLTEECAKLGTSGCNDTTNNPGRVLGGGLGTLVEEALPKLYAAMGTLAFTGGGGGGLGSIRMRPRAPEAGSTSSTPNGQPSTTGEGNAAESGQGENKRDWCMVIPMGGELAAAAFQRASENQVQQQTSAAATAGDAQKESLYAVARVHDARAKTANLQGGVYAATAACYVYYMATGADMSSPMLWVKMGAAGAMSMIFLKKAAKHKEYADSVREVARKLPGAGDCNPHTQTQCFCGEPTSQTTDPSNWRKVCVPQELSSGPNDNTPGTCSTINSSGVAVADTACACKATNSCLDTQLASIGTQIGFGSMAFRDAAGMLAATQGGLDEASISAQATRLNAATTAALGRSPVRNVTPLADGRARKVADELARLGLPPSVATAVAAQQGRVPADSALAAAPLPAATLSGTGGAQAGPGSAVRPVTYEGGAAARGAARGVTQEGFVNPFAPKQETKKTPAVQIETFAQQAVGEADITRDSSRGIFDIISHRYRNTAWSRFGANGDTSTSP